MSIVTAVVLVGVGCAIIHQNSPVAQEERRKKTKSSRENGKNNRAYS